MDIISRLPGCAGQAADAVSVETQVKMEDAPTLLRVPKSEVQRFGYVQRSTNGPNHGPVWKTQSFFSKGICTVIVQQEYSGKGNLRKSHNVSLSNEQEDYSYQCMWTISKLAGKTETQNRL